MNAAGKIFAFLVGAGISTFVAFAMVIVGDDSKGFGRAMILIESPVMIVASWFVPTPTIGLYMILHLGYWFLLGGCLSLGVAAFFSWLVKNDN